MLMSGKFCRMQNMVAVRGAPSGAPVFPIDRPTNLRTAATQSFSRR